MTLSVSELNTQIKALVESNFLQVSIRGEISNLTIHSSGHIYFSLKDKDSQIRCVLFKGSARNVKFKLENGLKVIAYGSLSLYIPRGEYQIQCVNLSIEGLGELILAYEQLKARLKEKGYFDKATPLPKFPRKIAILTSLSGAAVHDMLKIASKRWNLSQIFLLDTLVQGESAPESIARNIAYIDSFFNTKNAFDVIIIGRGGGSIEDLWAFNTECVAEAIFNARTPIISAVGHESDVVISDFVADMRAPTPSGAMELLLPDKQEWLLRIDEMLDSLHASFLRTLRQKDSSLQNMQALLYAQSFESKNTLQNENLKNLKTMLDSQINALLQEKSHVLESLQAQLQAQIPKIHTQKLALLQSLQYALDSKNPHNLITQGFVQLRKDGKNTTLNALKSGDVINLEDALDSKSAQILP
ncbi:exodeoxyribonuclease VII large subunit [Helicobacter himalayensis]|uniref:exodeoxyribonuclease VII large subunit n=1 Tax=Helicobacter himalayensis TaxID=1591088 RepID=UPI00082F30AD|nr:exodeoxyribonuclease VII large subunit [Helicobacter himalayensis]